MYLALQTMIKIYELVYALIHALYLVQKARNSFSCFALFSLLVVRRGTLKYGNTRRVTYTEQTATRRGERHKESEQKKKIREKY